MNRGQTLQMSRLQCCGDGREIAEIGATGSSVCNQTPAPPVTHWPVFSLAAPSIPGLWLAGPGPRGQWQSYRNEDGPDTRLWPGEAVSCPVWSGVWSGPRHEYAVNTGRLHSARSKAAWELIKKMHDTYFYLHWLRCNSYIHSHGQS